MAVIVDIPGIGSVEAKNAASEATLRELVNIMKGIGRGGGGGAGSAGSAGSAGGGGGGLSSSLSKKLASASSTATKGVLAMASSTKEGAKALAGLSTAAADVIKQFADVRDSLTGAASALAPIPIVGPALAGTLGAVAGAAESVAESFNEASKSGAAFGGSINEFSRAASSAGMTMEQFGGFIRGNSEAMLGFGTTVEGGARQFATVSRNLRSTSSDLYALGLSTQDINQGLADYGKMMRMQGLQGTQSNKQLVAGSQKYLKELDALAKITGVERAAKQKEMEATLQDAQFQGAMAKQSKEVRDSFLNTLGGLAGGMQGPLASLAKDILATGTATSEENQKLLAQMPQSAAMLNQFRAKMQRGETITEAERNKLNNLMAREGAAASQRMGGAFAAAPEYAETMKALTLAQSMQQDALVDATDEQKKAAAETDKQNQAIQQAKQSLAEFSNSFQMALANSGLIGLLMDSFSFLANIVQTFVVPAFNMLAPILSKMFYGIQALAMPIIERFSGSLGGLEGTVSFIDNLLNTVFEALGGVIRGGILAFEGIKEAVMTLFDPLKRMYESIFGVSDSTATFGQTMIKVGSFIGDVFRVLGDVLGYVIDALQPFWKIIGAVVGAFTGLIDFMVNFDDYKTDLQETIDSLIDGMLRMLNKITFGAAGISEDEYKEREKAREEAKEARLKEREAAEKAQVEGLKQDQKEFSARKISVAKLGGINKEEAAVRKDALKGKEESAKNLSDPIQLLMAEAKQQKSGLIKTPTGTAAAAAQGAKAAVEAKAEEKAAEENKAKEAAKSTTNPTETPSSSTPGQTSGQTAIAQLNNNIEELVRLMRINNSLTSEQSSGLSRLAGSVTGDLFQV